jgi:hypothetical protein
LKILRNYLNENFEKEYIQCFISSADALILFVFKKNEGFRLYVNYRNLNKITVKNRHSFFLVREILDRLNGAAVYTKLDLKNTYYKIRTRKGDEWKTAFRIRYSYFEYKMILFDIINVSAIF